MAGEAVEECVIVGGGIAGLATALALNRVGKKSLVLERLHELPSTGGALTLFPNAWRALRALGVAHKLLSQYRCLQGGCVINLVNGSVQAQSFAAANEAGESIGTRLVHRKVLLEAMAAELPPDTIRFSSRVASIKAESKSVVVLKLEDGRIISTKTLIGCDGLNSEVAKWLGLALPKDSGRSAVRALSVFPRGHGFSHVTRQFLSADKRAGIFPVNENDICWFITHLTTPKVKEIGRDPEKIQCEVMNSLAAEFPLEFKHVVERSEPWSMTWDPLFYRTPWEVLFGRTHSGCVTVAGDALHPMTPELGQGGCIALEDAVVLARCLARAESSRDVEAAFAHYVAERRWRAAGLIVASYLSGSVQQASAGVWTGPLRLLRNFLFYRFVFAWIVGLSRFDCGILPSDGYG